MLRKNSLSMRIILRVITITTLLFVVVLTGYYYYTRNVIRDTTREYAIQLAGNIAGKIEQQIQPLEKIPEMLSATLEMNLYHPDSLIRILTKILELNDNIFGSCIAFEPGFLPQKGHYFMSYAYRDAKGIQTAYPGSAEYDYHLMDWYQIPAMLHVPYWSEPYYDEGAGNALMATYSVPFFMHREGIRVFAGIATVDVDLEWLGGIVSQARIFESGYTFIISRNGMAIAHPDQTMVMNETIFSNAENWEEPLLREIGRDLRAGKSSFRKYNLKGRENRWIYYANMPSGVWSIAVVYPDSEMFATLKKMNLLLLAMMIAGLMILVASIVRIVSQLASPLSRLSNVAEKIAEGNFNAELPEVRSKDEILELRNAFGYMQEQLAIYIENLKETTSAKEKIESELRIARDIQLSMIPHSFPPFPDLPQIELFAYLKSAKEVGGDLYDFFAIDNRKFIFAIGDVSGKGVPASLMMAVTRTLLRSIADKEENVAKIIYALNNSLAINNDSCMFVTFFLAVLDIQAGQLSYANAGHNYPLLISPDGEITVLRSGKTIPLGLQEDFEFSETILQLHPGDKIFTYTDGVSEAENAKQELFGESAISEVIRDNSFAGPQELIAIMETAIEAHVDGYPQSDDITMMTLKYNG